MDGIRNEEIRGTVQAQEFEGEYLNVGEKTQHCPWKVIEC